MIVVVDASVAAMWFLPERGSEMATLLLAPEYELVAPDLILLEVGSALLKALRRSEISFAECDEALFRLLPAAVRTVPASSHASAAFGIAQRMGGSVYDAIYVALGRALDAPVVTNDSELAAVARRARIKVRMIAEGPPPVSGRR